VDSGTRARRGAARRHCETRTRRVADEGVRTWRQARQSAVFPKSLQRKRQCHSWLSPFLPDWPLHARPCSLILCPCRRGLALVISRHNARSFSFLSGLVTAGALGMAIARALLSTYPISKYPHTDAIFGVVFTMACAATGAFVGAFCDRWLRPRQSKDPSLPKPDVTRQSTSAGNGGQGSTGN
jgi:hypothetical protein